MMSKIEKQIAVTGDLLTQIRHQNAELTALRARVVELKAACAQARAWCIELASTLPAERNQLFGYLWPHINGVLREGKPECVKVGK